MHKILEESTPFRSSILWSLQDEAYTTFGASAWSEKGVPSYLTSHPLVGSYYAQLILAFLRDIEGAACTIIDLGAGTGRLAYHILDHLPLDEVDIRYVLTDITQEHLDKLEQHPKLKPYFEKGVLQTALYHHESTTPPEAKGPTVVIGNYYLDTLPQTLYRAVDGRLEEGYTTITASEKGIDAINGMDVSYSYRESSDEMPGEYAKQLQDGLFLDPHGGFSTLQHYIDAGEPLLFLTADQGIATKAQSRALEEPVIARHGTFSVTVDYNYVAFLLGREGFDVLLPTVADPTLVFLVSTRNMGKHVARTFGDTLDAFTPTDYLYLSNLFDEVKEPSLQQLLAIIKAGRFDAINTYLLMDKIEEKVSEDCTDTEGLARVLEGVVQKFYPISKQEAMFYDRLGVLLFNLGKFQEALICFQQHLYYGEPTDELLKNISACLAKVKRT